MAFAEVQVGTAKIFGMDGGTIAYGAVAAQGNSMEGVDVEDSSTISEVMGQDGEMQGLISSNRTLSLTVQFAPAGATRVLAIASANAMMALGPLVKVTIAGFAVTGTGGPPTSPGVNGDYVLESKTFKYSRDGYIVFTLKLKAPVNATARTAVTGTVIAT